MLAGPPSPISQEFALLLASFLSLKQLAAFYIIIDQPTLTFGPMGSADTLADTFRSLLISQIHGNPSVTPSYTQGLLYISFKQGSRSASAGP